MEVLTELGFLNFNSVHSLCKFLFSNCSKNGIVTDPCSETPSPMYVYVFFL